MDHVTQDRRSGAGASGARTETATDVSAGLADCLDQIPFPHLRAAANPFPLRELVELTPVAVSSRWPAAPPRARPRAPCLPISLRVAAGRAAIVRWRVAAARA